MIATFAKHFEKYGEIVDSIIIKDRSREYPRGFGFITYADPAVVVKVIEENHVIYGKQGLYRQKTLRHKIFVGGIPSTITEDEFKNLFSKYGKYRLDFSSGMKENASFADVAPTFWQMAEETLEKQLQLVISSLNEAIDGADGFQNTHKMQQYESAKFSIDQVMFILEKVRILWNPLLLRSTYKRIMCLVLESIFSRIIKDVLQLDDLAAEETLQLQRLIHFTLDNLSSLFDSLIDESRVSEESMSTHLENLLPSLRKVRKLADLLDMPLKSITTAWESGELAFCGFASSEVQSFVKAIFTDSPLRRDCLWRIERSSF